MRKYKIEVFQIGDDDQHIVQLTVYQEKKRIGVAQLSGGDFENAKSIAKGLKDLADSGLDLTEILPEMAKADDFSTPTPELSGPLVPSKE